MIYGNKFYNYGIDTSGLLIEDFNNIDNILKSIEIDVITENMIPKSVSDFFKKIGKVINDIIDIIKSAISFCVRTIGTAISKFLYEVDKRKNILIKNGENFYQLLLDEITLGHIYLWIPESFGSLEDTLELYSLLRKIGVTDPNVYINDFDSRLDQINNVLYDMDKYKGRHSGYDDQGDDRIYSSVRKEGKGRLKIGSFDNIIEDLAKINGMNQKTAENVYNYYH